MARTITQDQLDDLLDNVSDNGVWQIQYPIAFNNRNVENANTLISRGENSIGWLGGIQYAVEEGATGASDLGVTGLRELIRIADVQDEIDIDLASTNQDAIDTAADSVQTGLDAVATNADVATTTQDAIDTAAAAVQTGLDAVNTAADVVTTNQNVIDTAAATNADAIATAADRVSTNQDVIDTASNVSLTNADVVTTSQDALDTAADLVATNQDRLDTATNLVATNQDTLDTEADAASTAQDLIDTAANLAATAQDVIDAAASASAADTSDISASGSASAAASSATAASDSQIAAAVSASSAANVFDSFEDTYLGSKTSEPTLDNDGNALVTGALYYNSVTGGMFVYDGADWVAASAAGGASLNNYYFTATAGQITFTGSDDNTNTLVYTQDNIIVMFNGVILEKDADYTASDGTSIVLTDAAVVGDEVNIIAFKSFTTADMVSASSGGAFYGNVDFNNGIDVTGNVTVTGTVDGRDVSADGAKLDGIEALADVTDTINVTEAGALMDIEVTNLAQVKAFAAADYATAAQGTLAADAAPKLSPTFTGTPAGPTAPIGTDTDQFATTAFTLENVLSSASTALTAAATVDIDLSSKDYFTLTADQNTTFTFSTPPASGRAFAFTLIFTQPAAAKTITWPASVDWAGGAAPDAPANSEVNAYGFITADGGTTYYGFLGGAALA
jgi:hypothetical protein